CARIYGLSFAAVVPLRIFWGNIVNCAATAEAVRLFMAARLRRHTPAWRKTDHVYPGDPLRIHSRPRLGEVLVGLRRISIIDLDEALARCPQGLPIGEYLVQL